MVYILKEYIEKYKNSFNFKTWFIDYQRFGISGCQDKITRKLKFETSVQCSVPIWIRMGTSFITLCSAILT